MVDAMWTRDETAAFLRLPPKTLAAWASRGEGPPYFRVGRFARYRQTDLEAWLERQRQGGQRVGPSARPHRRAV